MLAKPEQSGDAKLEGPSRAASCTTFQRPALSIALRNTDFYFTWQQTKKRKQESSA